MRWCAALAVVLVALLVVTVRGLRRDKRRARPVVDPQAAELAPPARHAEPRATASTVDREPPGIAHLRGRVLFPAGVEPTRGLLVTAEDFTRQVRARTSKDGRFEIHLPSGRYTLVAHQGPLIGVVPDVLLRSGSVPDLDIRLGAGAVIRGKLTRPEDGVDVDVTAVPTGRKDESGHGEVEDDTFSVAGLVPGGGYDLTFSGPDVRTLKLTGVTAPTEGIDVQLQARAKVRGAIGFPSGTPCPITFVELRSPGQSPDEESDDASSGNVGADCSFAITAPDEVTAVTVVATGDGWHLEQEVVIPPSGDPPPICLNAPCRTEPTEGLARLELTLDGAPTEMDASVFGDGALRGGRRRRDCTGAAGTCTIDGLVPGTTLSAIVETSNCRSEIAKVTVTAGDNHVRLGCHAQRRVEGVLRFAASEPELVGVRCAGSDATHPVLGTRLFQITCRADVAALEYQIGEEGAWHSVPIAPSSDLAFVEIGPL